MSGVGGGGMVGGWLGGWVLSGWGILSLNFVVDWVGGGEGCGGKLCVVVGVVGGLFVYVTEVGHLNRLRFAWACHEL